MSDKPLRLHTTRCDEDGCNKPAAWLAQHRYWCDDHVPPGPGVDADALPELTPEDEEWCRAFFLGINFGADERKR